jgi:hypothetical protein
MKARLFVAVSVSMLAAAVSTAGAQTVSSQCPPGTASGLGIPDQTRATQDACQKAIDLFQYMMPQLSVAITGGNAVLGSGSTLGGLGHFSLGLRANVLQGDLPQFDNSNSPSVNGAQRSTYTTKSQIIGLPVADMAIGIFKGLPLGLTNVGGLDAIVSASYLPAFNNSTFDVKVPNGSLKLGYGARLGILQESLLIPGVSVSYLRRDIPTVDITSNFNNDTLAVKGFNIQTKAWRVVASKSLLIFGLAVGGGQETYHSGASVSASLAPRAPFTTTRTNLSPVALSQDLTRTNVFADLSMNLPLFKLVAEAGQVSGGSISTYNSFSGRAADASRVYGSVGVRLGF